MFLTHCLRFEPQKHELKCTLCAARAQSCAAVRFGSTPVFTFVIRQYAD